ncbi:hypothetical protein TNCV_2978941 [Trichonephila clavipes]|nr:hypothetical protein TNCV_2978941 [Trichonephila clavipes]
MVPPFHFRSEGYINGEKTSAIINPMLSRMQSPEFFLDGFLKLNSGVTLNSRRVASPLVKLVEKEEKWEALDHLQGVLSQNWNGTDKNRAVTCMELKARANDRYTSGPLSVGVNLTPPDS